MNNATPETLGIAKCLISNNGDCRSRSGWKRNGSSTPVELESPIAVRQVELVHWVPLGHEHFSNVLAHITGHLLRDTGREAESRSQQKVSHVSPQSLRI